LAEIDFQFREKDIITLYCGKTAILNIKPDWHNNQFIFSAHKTYSTQSCFPEKCIAISDIAEKVVRNYVDKVLVINSQWAGEGIVQSSWIERYSRKFKYGDPCFIFDREGVLGFDSTVKRDEFIKECKKSLNATMAELVIQSKDWAPYEDGFPTEIDFVGASPSGDSIFIIEAKQIKSASNKLYYSPIQVASYAIAWCKAIESKGFLSTVNKLIRAKKKAYLISGYCKEIDENPSISPVLLLPVRQMSIEVKRRLKLVLNLCNLHLPQAVSKIVVWDCESTESCQSIT